MLRALRQLLAFIRTWWRRRRRHHTFTGVEFVDSFSDPALALRSRRLVFIGPAEKPKWLRFACLAVSSRKAARASGEKGATWTQE